MSVTSNISNNEFMKHFDDVDRLKQQFIDAYKKNHGKDKLIECIKHMRCYHGCAEVEYAKYVSSLGKNASEDEYILVSSMCSMLHVIHCSIRHVEKLMFRSDSSLPNINGMMSTDSDDTVRGFSNLTNSRKSKSLTDEISLDLPTESEKPNSSSFVPLAALGALGTSLFASNASKKPKSSMSDFTFTDMVENLNESEAEKLFESDLKVDRPTLILYWGDWCPASNKFYPTWTQLKDIARTKYPNLQIVELNFNKEDASHSELAKKMDIKSFPTVVYLHDKKIDKISGSNKTLSDIEDLIKA